MQRSLLPFILLLTLFASPQAITPPVDVSAIATLVADPAQVAAMKLKCQETWTTGDHSTPDERELATGFFYKGVLLREVVSHDDRPLRGASRSGEAKKTMELKSQVDAAIHEPEDFGRLVDIQNKIWSLRTLLRRFAWMPKSEPSAQVSSSVTYAFQPISAQPTSDRLERMLFSMAGDVTLDRNTGQIRHVEFHNIQPIKYGLLARYQQVDGTFDLYPDWQRTGIYARSVIHVSARKLFRTIRGTDVDLCTIR